MDAVTRYDIDGVHFDDYFYPYPVAGQEFDDASAYARYGAGFPDRAAWRRDNVDLLIREIGERIRDARPEVQWGVSPFGIWRNSTSDPLGSATSGSQSYDHQHADTRGWVKKGWLDYIAPQIYWSLGQAGADYAVLTPWWARVVAGTDTQLWIGQAAYKVGIAGQPAPWQDPAELTRHLTFNRDFPQVGGDVYYSSGDLRADRLGAVTLLHRDHYSRPALAPVLPRLASGDPPRRPVISRASVTGDGVELAFRATGHAEPRLYAIYRFDGPDAERADSAYESDVADAANEPDNERAGRDRGRRDEAQARHLIAVVPGAREAGFADPGGKRGSRYRVTALDAANRQSVPSASKRAG